MEEDQREVELVRECAGFFSKGFDRWSRYGYRCYALLLQAFEKMGERFIEPAQLRECEESKFSSVHTFKGR